MAALAALLHDLGKATQAFQERLRNPNLRERNHYRHEWVSVRMFQAFVGSDDDAGWLQRLGCQFHWQNRGYRDFQDFLDALSSRKRKQMRKEREQVAGQGFEFEWLEGQQVTEAQWDFVYACYANTYAVRRQSPYLTRAFFSQIGRAHV